MRLCSCRRATAFQHSLAIVPYIILCQIIHELKIRSPLSVKSGVKSMTSPQELKTTATQKDMPRVRSMQEVSCTRGLSQASFRLLLVRGSAPTRRHARRFGVITESVSLVRTRSQHDNAQYCRHSKHTYPRTWPQAGHLPFCLYVSA